MVTYNQETYISEAIESVLHQETNFRYQLYIGEDCSTDNTRNICMQYKERYPDKINLVLNTENNINKNLLNTYLACFNSGCKYVALLEGDDFWTDPYKIQKQVEFLECHPEYTMCFTNSAIVDEHNNIVKESRLESDRRRNLAQIDIISGLVPPTNTMVIRNQIGEGIYQINNTINGDLLISALATETGKAGYIDEVTACYRIHAQGVWASKSREYRAKNYLKTCLVLLGLFRHKYDLLLYRMVNNGYADLLRYQS